VTALAPAGLNQRPPLSQPTVLRRAQLAAKVAAPMAPVLLRPRAVRALGFRSVSSAPGAIGYADAVESVRRHAGSTGYQAALDGILGGQFARADQIGADVPVTIVRGDRDDVLPEANNENHALAPAHARWVRLPRCGHVPQWDAPGAVTRLVVQTAARAGGPA
jgi:pimeloyl-ACP methyl ester carboxylesterase